MKVIFSPTKTMKLKPNNWINTNSCYVDKHLEVLKNINCIKSDLINQAIYYYNGISYKYLDVESLDNDNLTYLENNLYILSALYGVLKPSNSICEYRLDFTKNKELYSFWNDTIIDTFDKEDIIINLASNEYLKMIDKNNSNKVINIEFRSNIDNKIVNKATYSKIARGLMLRYMALNNVDNIDKLKEFNEYGYTFNKELSNNNNFIFIRKE